MDIFSFSSNRDKDYAKISDKKKRFEYFLKRGNLLTHLVDRLKWHMAPKFFHVVDFPTHLDIEASFSCQMRCPMCTRRRMPKDLTFGNMDLKLFKKIVDECIQRGIYSIKLSWRGEPLLNPNIVDMVKYAKDNGIRDVAFLTNGERLNSNLTEGLVDAGLDWISFSIDGLGETYDRIRWPSNFEGISEKVKRLKEYRDSKGLKKPLIRVQTIWGAIKDNPTDYFNYWEKFADKVCIIADQKRMEEKTDFPKNEQYMCFEPWRRIIIGWDGKVMQCITDYDELNVVGDVNKESLYEIWHGSKMTQLRELAKNKKLFENKACAICDEPGIMEERTIKVEDREIKINLYKGQELDVSKMDARPKKTVEDEFKEEVEK